MGFIDKVCGKIGLVDPEAEELKDEELEPVEKQAETKKPVENK